MTEKQWFKSRDTAALLVQLKDQVSDRKLRLFAVACCQRIAFLILDPASRRAVKVAERLAEGRCTEGDAAVWTAREEAENAFQDDDGKGCEDAREAAFDALEVVAFEAAEFTSFAAVYAVRWQEDFATRTKKLMDARAKAEEVAQVALLRDIFGNPFRPVTLDRAWLTSDVLALARGIYAKKAFDRMPILADALQDAGCNNDDLLAHCRDTQLTHVRGCWVVDLLLEKK